jgi:hypothetical protein
MTTKFKISFAWTRNRQQQPRYLLRVYMTCAVAGTQLLVIVMQDHDQRDCKSTGFRFLDHSEL